MLAARCFQKGKELRDTRQGKQPKTQEPHFLGKQGCLLAHKDPMELSEQPLVATPIASLRPKSLRHEEKEPPRLGERVCDRLRRPNS